MNDEPIIEPVDGAVMTLIRMLRCDAISMCATMKSVQHSEKTSDSPLPGVRGGSCGSKLLAIGPRRYDFGRNRNEMPPSLVCQPESAARLSADDDGPYQTGETGRNCGEEATTETPSCCGEVETTEAKRDGGSGEGSNCSDDIEQNASGLAVDPDDARLPSAGLKRRQPLGKLIKKTAKNRANITILKTVVKAKKALGVQKIMPKGKSFVSQVLRDHPNRPMIFEEVGAHTEKENDIASAIQAATAKRTLAELHDKLRVTDRELDKLKAEREHKIAIEKLMKDHAKATNKMAREHERDKLKAVVDMQESYQQKEAEYEAVIKAKDEDHAAAIVAKEEAHEVAVHAFARKEKGFRKVLKQKQDRYNRVFSELKQSAMDALQRMKREHECELMELRAAMLEAHEYLVEIEGDKPVAVEEGDQDEGGDSSADELADYEEHRHCNVNDLRQLPNVV
jgi:hypothetical protein